MIVVVSIIGPWQTAAILVAESEDYIDSFAKSLRADVRGPSLGLDPRCNFLREVRSLQPVSLRLYL
jgi:hypothetical protein